MTSNYKDCGVLHSEPFSPKNRQKTHTKTSKLSMNCSSDIGSIKSVQNNKFTKIQDWKENNVMKDSSNEPTVKYFFFLSPKRDSSTTLAGARNSKCVPVSVTRGKYGMKRQLQRLPHVCWGPHPANTNRNIASMHAMCEASANDL